MTSSPSEPRPEDPVAPDGDPTPAPGREPAPEQDPDEPTSTDTNDLRTASD